MDCIDLFKRAAVALQTDPRYLALDQARKANDNDENLQNLIGEFNLARMDLNNEIGKSERDDARITELNEKVNNLYGQIMGDEGMTAYNEAKRECENLVNYIDAIINTARERRRPDDRAGAFRFLQRKLLHLRRLPLTRSGTKRGCAMQTAFCVANGGSCREPCTEPSNGERGKTMAELSPDDAAISGNQRAAQGRASCFTAWAIFTRCSFDDAITGVQGAGADPHRPGLRAGRAGPHVRRALPQRTRAMWRSLIAKGYKVAICEQMEDPAHGQRAWSSATSSAWSRPARSSSSSMLQDDSNNYIASIYLNGQERGPLLCGCLHRRRRTSPSCRRTRSRAADDHRAVPLPPQRECCSTAAILDCTRCDGLYQAAA